MAIEAAQLSATIITNAKQASAELKEVGGQVTETGGFFRNAASTLLGFVGGDLIIRGVGAAFDFLKGQLVDSVKAGADANSVMAQTVAGLKSTHDASGQTAQSIGDLATHIMSLSGIDDDAVQTGENMLLTFTNIGKSVFPAATQAAADMATKMNGGLIPSASQMQQQSLLLGKALNDPLKGITALTREGVTFTDQQKQSIATMMKHGDVAGAQGVILKELNNEFGGAAAAAGKANGGIGILTAQFNNMKESLGQQIIPILTQLMTTLSPLAQMLEGRLTQAIAGIQPAFAALSRAASMLDFGEMLAAFTQMGNAAERVGGQIQTAALPVLQQLSRFFLADLLPAVTQFAGFAATTLIPMFGEIAVFILQNVAPALIQLGAFMTDTVLPAVEQLVAFFKANVLPVLEVLVKVFLTDVLPVLEQLATTILTKVMPPLERMMALILPVLIPAFQAIGWVILNVVGPALNVLLTVIGWLMDKFVDMATLLSGQVGAMFSALGTFAHNVGGIFSSLGTLFHNAGHDLIQGLINGLTSMFGPAIQSMSDLGGKMLSSVKGVFGIHSPSAVFAEIGGNLSQGLINGVKRVDVAGEVGKHLAGLAPQMSASLGVNASVTGGGNLAGLAGIGLAQQIAALTGGSLAAGGAGGIPGGISLTIPVQLGRNRVGVAILPDLAQAIRQGTGQRS